MRWYLQVNAFFQDFSDTDSFDKGPRLKALLRKRKIPDDVQSNQLAIESDLFETSAPSEESDALLRGLGLSGHSDDGFRWVKIMYRISEGRHQNPISELW